MMKHKLLITITILSFVFISIGESDIGPKEIEKVNAQISQGQFLSSHSERIFVKYKKQPEGLNQASIKASIEATYGIQETKYFSFIDVYLYETFVDKEDVLESLSKNPNVEYAEPDYVVSIDSTTPNDPNFGNLWGMHNDADTDIDAPEAWDLSTGSSSIVVAVIDTGVDYNHEDLSTNMWTNSGEIPGNGIDDDGNGYVDDYYGINGYTNNGDPMDDHGHGTHVSGTVAAVGNNGIGVVGVCWTAKIMALKFLTSGGWGYTSDAVKCVNYAIDKGADIMSNSWGGSGYSSSLKAAIEAAKNAGILFLVAAGNDGTNNDVSPYYPSSYDCDNIISVSAVDSSDNQWYNYGPISVDVAAPGRSITSTYPNNSYVTWSGTSMATPHVAGLAALLKSYDTSLTWQNIKNRILDNVVQIASLQGKISTGGRINAYNSLSQGSGTPPNTPSNPSPSNSAIGVSIVTDLDWDDSLNATSYDVYFGATYPPPLITSVTDSAYDPGILDYSTSYYWKIAAKNSNGETTGSEWNFTTDTCSTPDIPVNPLPPNGIQGVSADIDLNWDNSNGATSYDVYFGTVSPPSFAANVTDSSYDVGTLSYSSTYYWKIVAKNSCGEIDGPEWNFETEASPSSPKIGYLRKGVWNELDHDLYIYSAPSRVDDLGTLIASDYNSPDGTTVGITAIDIDGDGVEEIAYLRSGPWSEFDYALYIYSAPTSVDDFFTLIASDYNSPDGNTVGITAIDIDGDGVEEIAYLRRGPWSEFDYDLYIYSAPTSVDDFCPLIASDYNSPDGNTVGITAIDIDGDGVQEMAYLRKGHWNELDYDLYIYSVPTSVDDFCTLIEMVWMSRPNLNLFLGVFPS